MKIFKTEMVNIETGELVTLRVVAENLPAVLDVVKQQHPQVNHVWWRTRTVKEIRAKKKKGK